MKEEIKLIRHGDRVCILINGKLSADLPAEVALQVGAGLIAHGRSIMNDRDPEKQIIDQAILNRAGIAIGLTDNPKVLKEAFKEAQWNTDLRKKMPHAKGIPSSEVVGTPTVTRGAEKCLKH